MRHNQQCITRSIFNLWTIYETTYRRSGHYRLCYFRPFPSNASAPSPESIEKLLIVTKADKMIDSVMQSMEGMLSSMGDKMRPAGEDTPEAKANRYNSMKKMLPIMKEELI